MKKKYLILAFILMLVTTGCRFGKKNVFNGILDKYKNIKSYHLNGELEVLNNEDNYKYDVDVFYKKNDNYKVSLTNKNNNHEQIILKNKDALYVLTPSLNKSFKFQSNWPKNNSQVYLIESIISDLKSDNDRNLVKKDNEYIYTIKVNYPNNRKLINGTIHFDKNYNLKLVEIKDENDIVHMKMTFNNIDLSVSIDDETFNVDNIIKNKEEISEDDLKNEEETSKLDETIYPLYIPSGTVLSNQENIDTSNGKRIIMTFDGEKSFTLIEENSTVFDEFEIIPTSGEPCLLTDTVAALSDTSVTWSSGNIDYYLVSDVLSKDEILDVARSISVVPTMK